MVGSSHSNKALLRDLENLAQQNSAHIELFDSTESDVDQFLGIRNQGTSAESEHSQYVDQSQRDLLNFDREKLFAAVLVQDTDCDNGSEGEITVSRKHTPQSDTLVFIPGVFDSK